MNTELQMVTYASLLLLVQVTLPIGSVPVGGLLDIAWALLSA